MPLRLARPSAAPFVSFVWCGSGVFTNRARRDGPGQRLRPTAPRWWDRCHKWRLKQGSTSCLLWCQKPRWLAGLKQALGGALPPTLWAFYRYHNGLTPFPYAFLPGCRRGYERADDDTWPPVVLEEHHRFRRGEAVLGRLYLAGNADVHGFLDLHTQAVRRTRVPSCSSGSDSRPCWSPRPIAWPSSLTNRAGHSALPTRNC
jgi:hypothetical protein